MAASQTAQNAPKFDKMFEPSLWGWTTLIPQRVRSYSQREDKEFMQKFQRMKLVLDDLKRIEAGIARWHACTRNLAAAARELGKAVQTREAAFKEVSWNLDIEIKDDSALQNIREKIRMIEMLIAQRSKLKYIRLKGEYADYKLRQIRKKASAESYQADTERYLTIKKEAAKQREDIMAQVLVVVNKYVDQAEQNGVSDLVKPQLQSFKLSQFHVFLNCQKLIAGPDEDNNVQELEQHWNNFTSKIASDIPNHEAGGSFVASTQNLAAKLDDKGKPDGYKDSDFDGEEINAADLESRADEGHKDDLTDGGDSVA